MKCNRCSKEKNEDDFYKSNKSTCKECCKKKSSLWQKQNAEAKHRYYKRTSDKWKKVRSDYYYSVEMGVDPEFGRQRAELKRKIVARKKLLKTILKQEKDFHANRLRVDGLKKCSSCKKEKELNQFYSSNHKCKPCASKAASKSRIKRLKKDPLFKFQEMSRISTIYAFKRTGYRKTSNTHKLLGCSWETLRDRFEEMFEEGMTWDNHGEWHIDHIVPLSTAKTKEDVVRLCHYTNLQPLWAEDNLAKSDNLNWRKTNEIKNKQLT